MAIETDSNSPRRCEFCKQKISGGRKYMEHITKVHVKKDKTGRFVCPFRSGCYQGSSRRFSTGNRSANMPTHIGSKHTGIKIYACRYCPEMFAGRSALGKHEKAEKEALDQQARENKADENRPVSSLEQEEVFDDLASPSLSSISHNAVASSSTAPIYPQHQLAYTYQFPCAAPYPFYAPLPPRAYVTYPTPDPAYPSATTAAGLLPETPDWNSAYILQRDQEFPELPFMGNLSVPNDQGYFTVALPHHEVFFASSAVAPVYPPSHLEYPTYSAAYAPAPYPTYFDLDSLNAPPPYTYVDPAPVVPQSVRSVPPESEAIDERPRKRQRRTAPAATRSTPYDRTKRRRRVADASTVAPNSPTATNPTASTLTLPLAPIESVPAVRSPAPVDFALDGPFALRWNASPAPSLASSANDSDIDDPLAALIPPTYPSAGTPSYPLEDLLDPSLWSWE